jgi:hypothetical protein
MPGGSICTLHNKWIGSKIAEIADPSQMGRWCGFRMRGKQGKHINVISAYRPTCSTDMTNNTLYSRQWRHITKINPTQPANPRAQMLLDLAEEIKKWTANGDEIILGTDTNDDLSNKSKDLTNFIESTLLLSSTRNLHQPATYNRETKTIDYVFCS